MRGAEWKLWLDSCRLGLALLMGGIMFASSTNSVSAQIIPDATLGAESSVVNPDTTINGSPASLINGGATRGINLFHSFGEFNVGDGQGVYFVNPSGIENIISRVSGSNASNILGTLGITGGNANLFLINPNGIIFGQNARLDIGGSFVASTANAIEFGNNGFFSATNPDAPSQLLTINPRALFLNQISRGEITNRSVAPAGQNLIGEDITGLRVPDGKSLLLLGGNVNLEGGGLFAYGGNIELAGLAAPGNVGLNIAGSNLSFSVPNGVERANVSLSNGAEVNVRAADGGNIGIFARNVSLTGESKVRAAIETGLGTSNSKGGDVVINATGTTNLTDKSLISNSLRERAFGKSGNVNITTETLTLGNEAIINVSTLGQGDAGNIFINASNEVSLTSNTAIYSSVASGSVGNGGEINIKTESLSVTDGASIAADVVGAFEAFAPGRGNAGNINLTVGSLFLNNGGQLSASTSGEGNAGSVFIEASNAVSLTGSGSAILSDVETGGKGNGGNIKIQADSLSLTDDAGLSLSIFGDGNGGNVSIEARGSVSLSNSTIFNTVEAGGRGNGGNINIQAISLSVTEGAQLQTLIRRAQNNLPGGVGNGGNVKIDVSGAVTIAGAKDEIPSGIRTSVGTGANGNAGNITINADSFSLTDDATLNLSTFGQGNAGNVSIQAKGSVSLVNGNIYSTVEAGAEGDGGYINIKAASLSLTNNAEIKTSISQAQPENNLLAGKGNGGNVNIDVSGKVTFANPSPGRLNGINTEVEAGATGNGGSVTINAGSLEVTGGSEIQSSTRGKGNSGTITINARESISFDGSSDGENFSRAINAVQPKAEGNAGGIRITTGSLSLTNGAFLGSSTNGIGNAGDITIDARDTINFDSGGYVQSNVFKEGGEGKAGNIRLTTGSLSLTNGGKLTANVSGKGEAGDIIIEARDTVTLDGRVGFAASGVESSLFTSDVGKGGNIQITTGSLSVSNGALVSTNTDGQGNAGNITINARDTVTFEGFGGESALPSIATSSVGTDAVGNGGDIRVSARALLLKNGGQLNASSFGQGSGGNIIIDASDTVSFDGVGKRWESGAYSLMEGSMGKGGDIQVTTGSLFVTNGARLYTVGQGIVGNITIDAPNGVKFDGIDNGQASGAFSALLPGNPGKGGDIQVKAGSLSVTNGALINASSLGQGNGGNVTIDARDAVTFEGGSNGNSSGIFSLVFPDAVGKGGNLRVTAKTLSMNNNAGFLSGTLGQGDAGNIFVQVSENISLANSSVIASNVLLGGVGNGGNIDVETRNLTLTNGSGFSAGVYRAGQVGNLSLRAGRGQGGNIKINASESITLSGYDANGFSAGIDTLTQRGASGDAGDITITTANFRATDGAVISAATFNEGKGGDITINANIFELINGGQVLTNTRSSGNAGNIYLNVKDRITISGSDPNFLQRIAQVEERLRTSGSTDQLTDVVTNQGAASGLFANTSSDATGNGGNIIIDPRQMTIKDGGRISVNSEGTGNTGNISIQAGTLTLDNGTITARAASRTGGNINLNLGNLLLLRNGSEISTTAGIAGAGGDGGNITIDTPFIVAIPGENSDITANAFTGRGGNVNITTQGIFGIEFRPQLSDQSDITASSSFGISGVVDINSPDTDSVQNNLAEFSQNPIDTNNLIANSCVTRSNNQQGTFYITGSGGFPTRPSSLQISPYPIATAPSVSTATQSSKLRQQRKISELIVEAQGVYQLENGQLVLSRECP